MKWHLFILTLALFLACINFSYAKGIRTLNLSESDIAQIRVALGYSTLLQFDSRPSQAIVGDQDSFKVEYAGNSVAIKPVASGISTNLFVVTDYGKFNFRISSGQGFEPDYILRVKKKSEVPAETSSALITKLIGATSQKNGIELKLISVAATRSNTSLIYSFELVTKGKQITLQPGDFEILQAGRSLPIENIYLEKLQVNKGQKISGMALIRRDDLQKKVRSGLRFSHESAKDGLLVLAPPL